MPEPIDIKLALAGSIPGEQIVVALLNYATAYRQTMSQEHRDAFDQLLLDAIRRWNQFWIDAGVLKA